MRGLVDHTRPYNLNHRVTHLATQVPRTVLPNESESGTQALPPPPPPPSSSSSATRCTCFFEGTLPGTWYQVQKYNLTLVLLDTIRYPARVLPVLYTGKISLHRAGSTVPVPG